jgi:outer membrane protein W
MPSSRKNSGFRFYKKSPDLQWLGLFVYSAGFRWISYYAACSGIVVLPTQISVLCAMKRQLLLIVGLFVLLMPTALAQTERGVGWWSGSVGVQSGRADGFQLTNQTNTLGLSLTQGTFVKHDLLIGADLRLARTRSVTQEGSNFDAQTDDRQTTFAATPFVRQFFGQTALRGYVGGGVQVQYGRDRLLTSNTRLNTAETEQNRWQIRPQVQAGAVYLLNPRWGVELSARSSVVPLAFTDLSLGLVLLTDVKQRSLPTRREDWPQLMAGNWVVGGSFGVETGQRRLTSAAGERATNVQTEEVDQYTISPSVGYFLGSGWLVGVNVPISHRTGTNTFVRAAQTTSNTSANSVTNGIGVSPFIKKYLLMGRFGPFLVARAGLLRERTRNDDRLESLTDTYHWRVSGGLTYLMGGNFIVEGELAGIGNEWSSNTLAGETRRQFSLSATLRPTITLSYVFL